MTRRQKGALSKMDIEAGIRETRKLVQSSLKNSTATSFGEMTAHLAESAGKGMRTQLLLSASMSEEGLVPASAVKASAAVELLHMATLVHDDVIDDADTRRGHETLNKKFGNKNAILCGDYLLSMSITMLAGVEDEKGRALTSGPFAARFAKALASICEGECGQHLHNGNVDLSIFSYLRVIGGKTAALFYIAAFMGGVLGGETEEKAFALGDFGRQLGIAFQIADDCKDYELSKTTAQKPVGNDLKNGVVTLPLILAMRKNPLLRAQARAAMKNEADVSLALAQVRAAQGPEMAREVARRFEKKAERILSKLPTRKREALLAILRLVLPRNA